MHDHGDHSTGPAGAKGPEGPKGQPPKQVRMRIADYLYKELEIVGHGDPQSGVKYLISEINRIRERERMMDSYQIMSEEYWTVKKWLRDMHQHIKFTNRILFGFALFTLILFAILIGGR